MRPAVAVEAVQRPQACGGGVGEPRGRHSQPRRFTTQSGHQAALDDRQVPWLFIHLDRMRSTKSAAVFSIAHRRTNSTASEGSILTSNDRRPTPDQLIIDSLAM